MSVNLLFERVRLQAAIKRVYDGLPIDQADLLMVQVLERQRAIAVGIQAQVPATNKCIHDPVPR
jgi:hypothetical protein